MSSEIDKLLEVDNIKTEEFYKKCGEYDDTWSEALGIINEKEGIIELLLPYYKGYEGILQAIKSQVDMFDTAKEEDGEHTLRVSHKVLMSIKTKLEETLESLKL